jgi:ATP-dependent Clp protease ATP-binding subunit ClpX
MILRRTLIRAISPQARASSIALHRTRRRIFHASRAVQSSYNRSDFSGQGFSSFYEPDQPTRGPLGGTSNVGHAHVTPKALRQHLDQFVVGQDRAKVVLSVAVHEHYLRIQENQRRRDEAARLDAQAQRRASAFRHPVEGSFNLTAILLLRRLMSDQTR